MRQRNIGFILLVIVLFGLALTSNSKAIGVQPMVLELEGRPGEQYHFELSIFPESQQRVVFLRLYQPTQMIDGSVLFTEGDPAVYPPINWVKLEKNRVVVPPGEATIVNGTISVPFDAGGSYSVIVMVEPAVEDGEEGVTIIVRYAIRITVNVERPGLRSELKILDYDIIPDDDGNPFLAVHVENPSQFRFPITGESTIRDENRRLVERVQLKTPTAWDGGLESFSIYPETELLLVAPITEPLNAGKFYIQNFLSYDTSKQVIKGKEIFIEDGQFPNAQENLVVIKPENMTSLLREGAAATHILEIENKQTKSYLLQIGVEDIVPDYSRSVFEFLEVELRGESRAELAPRGKTRAVLLVRAPREAEPGGYYGKVNVNVFSAEQEYLETRTVPLTVLVGTEWERSAVPLSVAVEHVDESYLFSAVLLNSGNVHLKPHGTLELRNEEQVVVNVIPLELSQRQELLPEMTGFLTVTGALADVLPGEYLATVLVYEEQEQIGWAEFPLTINK